MRAWAVVENGQPLKEIELPTPEPTGTEVLLEVTHCGVCHSDLHQVRIQDIDRAYDRMQKGDVKYRFVIDSATLGG